jgi:hypothetical protein
MVDKCLKNMPKAFILINQRGEEGQAYCHTPIIPAMWEAEIGQIAVWG